MRRGRDEKQGETMVKNERITIEITGMTSEGSGVGKYEGMVVLVPQTAIGDTIEALIIQVAKNYAVGKISKLLSPSPDRCEVDCPVFSLCGGCEFRHVSYEAELRYKEQRVRDAIERIGGLDPSLVRPIIGAENPLSRSAAQKSKPVPSGSITSRRISETPPSASSARAARRESAAAGR